MFSKDNIIKMIPPKRLLDSKSTLQPMTYLIETKGSGSVIIHRKLVDNEISKYPAERVIIYENEYYLCSIIKVPTIELAQAAVLSYWKSFEKLRENMSV